MTEHATPPTTAETWRPPTYGELKERYRWIVAHTAGSKKPAADWTHPRSFTDASGNTRHKVKNLGKGGLAVTGQGIRVTSNSPETWLTYAESLEVCRTQFTAGSVLPAYVHGNPPGGEDDTPLLFLDADITDEQYRDWAKGVADEIGTLLPDGHPWMKSCGGNGRHLITALHPDDRADWLWFFNLRPIEHGRPRNKLTPPDDPQGGAAKIEWWNYVIGGGRYRIVTDEFPGAARWLDTDFVPVIRYADWAKLPTVAAYISNCKDDDQSQDDEDEEYPSDLLFERSNRGEAERFINFYAMHEEPVMWTPDTGVYIPGEHGVLIGIDTGEFVNEVYRRRPEVIQRFADSLEQGYSRPKSAKALLDYRRSGDTVRRAGGVVEAIKAIAPTHELVVDRTKEGVPITVKDLNKRTTPNWVARTRYGILDLVTGQTLAGEAAARRLITTDLAATPFNPDIPIQDTDAAMVIAKAVRESWGWNPAGKPCGWLQLLWMMSHPWAKAFGVLYGDGDRGKTTMYELLEILQFAYIIQEEAIGSFMEGKETPRFNQITKAFMTYPLVVMDEMANQNQERDTKDGNTGKDRVVGLRAVKTVSGQTVMKREVKHLNDPEKGGRQGMLTIVGNHPPLLDLRDRTMSSRIIIIECPRENDVLARYDRDDIVSSPVAEALLRLIMQDAASVAGMSNRDMPIIQSVQSCGVGEINARFSNYLKLKKPSRRR